MNRRRLTSSLLVPAAIIAFSGSALAGHSGNGDSYPDYNEARHSDVGYSDARYNSGAVRQATVLSADPIYRTVRVNNPVEQCWDERVEIADHRGYQSHTPKILGAIIGAAVGNKFGSGRGRHVATAAGAVLGGSIGRDVQSNRSSHGTRVVYEERCEVVDQFRTEQRIEGYDVTYRYNGQVLSTVTERDPGQTIKVSVSVVPVE